MKERVFIYFKEPNIDRWLPYDRYLRQGVRHILGRQRISGANVVFKNLLKGLRRLGVKPIVNRPALFRRHPDEVVGFIGKQDFFEHRPFSNPVVLGPAGYDHPLQDLDIVNRSNVSAMIVACDWAKHMFAGYWSCDIHSWPVGIDTDIWCPSAKNSPEIDFLLYDKISYRQVDTDILNAIIEHLSTQGYTFARLKYGEYTEPQLKNLTKRCRAAIVLSHTETQGLAYNQMMSAGLPVLAWDQGVWDTDKLSISRGFLPKGLYSRNSSVPYFDERCGRTFKNEEQYFVQFELFWEDCLDGKYAPRNYVLDNLSLERCAEKYLKIIWQYSK